MSRTRLGGLVLATALLSGVAACGDEPAAPKNPLRAEYYRVGASVAYLARNPGKIWRFDTEQKRLLAPLEMPGRVIDIVSGACDVALERSGPCLAVLTQRGDATERDLGDSLVIVRGDTPEVVEPEQPEQALDQYDLTTGYRNLLVQSGLAVAVSSPLVRATQAAGGADSRGDDDLGQAGAAVAQPTEVALLDLAKDEAVDESAEPRKPLTLSLPEGPSFVDLVVKRRESSPDSDSWLALAGPTQVLLVHTQGQGRNLRQLGSAFTVDLAEGRSGATRAPVPEFDRNASRVFLWAPNTSDLLWLDLSRDDEPTLARHSLTTVPSAVTLAYTGTTEVVVAVTPHVDGGSLVSVFDPLSLRVATVATDVAADAILTLETGEHEPDTIVFHSRNPANLRQSFGLASAESLAEHVLSVAAPLLPAITSVPLLVPYVGIAQADADHLFIEAQDGPAAIYDLDDGELRPLRDWNRRTHLVAVSGGLFPRIIADEREATGTWLIRSYRVDGGGAHFFAAPGPVRLPLQMTSSAFALIHTSPLGLLTYLETRGGSPASYTAAGFLAPELLK